MMGEWAEWVAEYSVEIASKNPISQCDSAGDYRVRLITLRAMIEAATAFGGSIDTLKGLILAERLMSGKSVEEIATAIEAAG